MKTPTTIRPRSRGGRHFIPAVLAAALVLGGCAATHVGDAWQCPLAQGEACTSVAAADPAVLTFGSPESLGTRWPLQRAEPGHAGGDGSACTRGCDPLALVADWFGRAEAPRSRVPVAETVSPPADEAAPDADGENLRTKEKIARIWIAPFVDADGVYREAHWVRTVLEPARWRLP